MPRAPRECPKKGCKKLQPCSLHPQGWKSNSTRPLPENWPHLKRVMESQKIYGCAWCHFPARLELDHIIPRSQGGGDQIDNLQWLCKRCHKAKTYQDKKRGR